MSDLLERAINKTILTISNFFVELFYAEAYSRKNGIMQIMPAEFKLLFIFLVISTIVLMKNPYYSLFIFILSIILVYLSKIPIRNHIKRCIPIPIFSFVVYIPIMLKDVLAGVEFFLRVLASVSFLILLISTTKIENILKTAEKIGISEKFTKIIFIAYRYSALLVRELIKLAVARQCRVVKNDYKFVYKTQISALGTFYLRVLERSERVYLSMKARGYRAK